MEGWISASERILRMPVMIPIKQFHPGFSRTVPPILAEFREGAHHQGAAFAGQHAPDLFGDKRGYRMDQLQDRLQHHQQHPSGLALQDQVLAEQIRLDPLHIPVAEFPPDELVEGLRPHR